MIYIKNCYFIINGIKFVIVYNDGKREILKEEQNQLVQLSQEEQKLINDILAYDDNPICKSQRLTQIFIDNDKLSSDLHVYNLLEWLEQNIPENCRENFYRNLSTLQINQNLDVINNQQTHEFTGGTVASYDGKTNTININEDFIYSLWQRAQGYENPQSYFDREYLVALLHEMSHMASSRYDHETGIWYNGFDRHGDRNTGLNEGMTEIVAMAGIPGTNEISSGYYVEASLVNQLIHVIGNEEVISSYFSAQGVEGIKHRLSEFGLNEHEAAYLLDQIELNYVVHSKFPDCSTDALGSVQSTLLDCFEERCRREISNPNFDGEKLETMLSTYGCMLVTPEVLQQNGIDPSNYGGLTENIERFRSLKERYIEEINNRRNQHAEELMEIKEQLEQLQQQQIQNTTQSYDEYRESLRNIYLEEKENDTVVHSQFNVTHGENPQCEHTVERINQDGRNIISQRTFNYNDDFRQQVLATSVIDYAQCSPIMSSEVKGHSNQMGEESQTADYQAVSENNNVLSVNNIEPQYANEISNAVQQIEPVAYQQQQSQQMAMQQEMGGQQLGLSLGSYPSIGGFASTIILSVVVGIICLLLIFLEVWILI